MSYLLKLLSIFSITFSITQQKQNLSKSTLTSLIEDKGIIIDYNSNPDSGMRCYGPTV